jgi:putative molybdopterin biosynthesis protein
MGRIKVKDNVFLNVTRFEDALSQLRKITHPIQEIETVLLKESLNRVLSLDIKSPINVPHFVRSARDGYALIAADTFGANEYNPVILRLAGEVYIGTVPNLELLKGECAKISTGAMIPKGADSITMIEYAEEIAGQVKVHRPAAPGENVIRIGTDIKSGQVVLKSGKRLTVFDSGVLSSIGLTQVTVYRRPKVAIMSTGNELLSAGRPLEAGKVYDANSITIYQAVVESGGIPIDFGILPDSFAHISDIVKRASHSSDVVLISGGTSKGPGDLMPAVIQHIGEPDLYLHGIAMKPGKPTILSSIGGKFILTLPGYPTSTLIVYYALVDPLIRVMAREPPYKYRKVEAYASTRIYSEIGRKEFKPCRISRNGEKRIYVEPMPTGSESLTTLAYSDGFIIIPEEVEFIDQDEKVELYVFPHAQERIHQTLGEQI